MDAVAADTKSTLVRPVSLLVQENQLDANANIPTQTHQIIHTSTDAEIHFVFQLLYLSLGRSLCVHVCIYALTIFILMTLQFTYITTEFIF